MGYPFSRRFWLCVVGWSWIGPVILVANSSLAVKSEEASFNCNPPLVLFAQEVSTTTATLSWTSQNLPRESKWNIELIIKGENFSRTPTHTNIETNPVTIAGLEPGTMYQFRVQAVCDQGTAWSVQTGAFITNLSNPSPCGMALEISDNNPIGNEFTIEVNNAPGLELGRDVQLREVRVLIEHGWERDLRLFLISPAAKIVELSSRNGGAVIFGGYGNMNAPDCANYTGFSSAYPNDSCRVIGSISDETLPSFVGRFFPVGNLNVYNDNTDPNGKWILHVIDDRAGNVGFLRYAELVFEPFNCLAPGRIEASQVKDSSLVVNWQSFGACQGAVIEYGPSGFRPGQGQTPGSGGNLISGVCPPYTITGLRPIAEYDIYVRVNCSNGSYSENSCLLNITTDCNSDPPTLAENFDEQGQCEPSCGTVCEIEGIWSNESQDNFDWVVYSGPTPTENTGPEDDLTGGGNYIFLPTDNSPCWNEKKAILRSSCIEIIANPEGCDMSFNYHMFGAGIGSIELEMSTDGGLSWIPLWNEAGSLDKVWKRAFVDLSAFDGQIAQFRFIGQESGNTGNIALDDIEFFGSRSLGPARDTFYLDLDNDGFGDASQALLLCTATPPAGYVIDNSDCNDNNAAINPDAQEVLCNRLDENCNGNGDDAIFPDVPVQKDTLCPGEQITLIQERPAQGTYYWYQGSQLVQEGNVFTTPPLNETTTYQVIDSSLQAPGLRITEIDLNSEFPGLEIQSIGFGDDYSGWRVLHGCNHVDINEVNPAYWSLGPMSAGEVARRTLAELGSGCSWLRFLNGWVMIQDDQGNIVDAVFWNWSAEAIAGLNIELDGQLITAGDLPWSGSGVNPQSCGGDNTINLFGNDESDNASDYRCGKSNLGQENEEIDMIYICQSNRIPITVVVKSLSLDAELVTNQCNVDNAGSIDLRVEGGFGNYSFLWSNGAQSEDLEEVQAGTFSVTVTDGFGCSSSLAGLRLAPPSQDFSISGFEIENPNCNSGADGAIKVFVTGGITPYNIQWSNGTSAVTSADSSQIRDLPPGPYQVTVTDANGCQISSEEKILADPNDIKISFTVENVDCPGQAQGAIQTSISGGTAFPDGSYRYQWSTGFDGANPSGLQPGNYNLTVTDANGCMQSSGNIAIQQPDPIFFELDSSRQVTCPGGSDGAIALTIGGGTPLAGGGYQYRWNNGFEGEDPGDLPAGEYIVTVTDDKGCTQQSPRFLIDQPAPIDFSLVTQDIRCHGESNGQITSTVKGGTPFDGGGYEYLWSNGAKVPEIRGLGAATYTLTVADANGCIAESQPVTLSEPAEIDLQLNTIDVLCNGDASGQIQTEVSGGVPLPDGSYNFLWSTGSTASQLTGVTAGEFELTVTDARNCQVETPPLPITEPLVLNVQIDSVRHVVCSGDANGQIFSTVTGATTPYTFNWGLGASNMEDPAGLSGGNYQLTLTDGNQCQYISDTLIVIKEAAVPLSSTIDTEPIQICPVPSGNINLEVTGGMGPYQYNWNNGSTSEDLIAVMEDDYAVTITDSQGCRVERKDINLEIPFSGPEIQFTHIDQVDCNGGSTATVEATVINGTGPYQFNWSAGVERDLPTNKDQLSNLSSGTYSLTVTDQSGCVVTADFDVMEPAPLMIENILTRDVNCFGESTGIINVQPSGGAGSYTFRWSNGSTEEDINQVPAGDYRVTITDANGCAVISDVIQIRETQIKALSVTVVAQKSVSCKGNSDGEIRMQISGGSGPYQYQWSSGHSTRDLTGIPGGTYTLRVLDANQCSAMTDTIVIDEPNESLVVTADVVNTSCPNAKDGAIDLNISGGSGIYQISWSNGANTLRADGLEPGLYLYTITDSNGCTVLPTDPLKVEASNAPVFTVALDRFNEISCPGACDGTLGLNIEGSTGPFLIEWTGDSTGEIGSFPEINSLCADRYRATVTDSLGCRLTTETFDLTEPDPLQLLLGPVTNASGCAPGIADGSAEILVQGGRSPYVFDWPGDLGNTAQVEALPAGEYLVTVTDHAGCQDTIGVEILCGTTSTPGIPAIIHNLHLFPNPTTGTTNLQVQLKEKAALEVQLFNINGQNLLTIPAVRTREEHFILDLNYLPKGIYFLKIRINEESILTRRLVVI